MRRAKRRRLQEDEEDEAGHLGQVLDVLNGTSPALPLPWVIAALPLQCSLSHDAAVAFVSTAAEQLDGMGREAAWECCAYASGFDKGMAVAVEVCKASSEHLEAYAVAIEEAIRTSSDPGSWLGHAHLLLASPCACSTYSGTESWFTVVPMPSAATAVIDAALSLSPGIDAVVVSGRGATAFKPGMHESALEHNVLRITLLNAASVGVDGVQACDVGVSIEGGSVCGQALVGQGVVEVRYAVPSHRLVPLTVHVSTLEGLEPPKTIEHVYVARSVVLCQVPAATRTAFLEALTSKWLCGATLGPRLYRGTQDGMSPRRFHELCDNKGPTLTFIRSSNGYTFGGYSSISWRVHMHCRDVLPKEVADAADAFLFSVVGPFGNVVCFPLREELKGASHTNYLKFGRELGPSWEDLHTPSSTGSFYSIRSHFDYWWWCGLGESFCDVLGQGRRTLAGAEYFHPAEIEVYSVDFFEVVPPVPPSPSL